LTSEVARSVLLAGRNNSRDGSYGARLQNSDYLIIRDEPHNFRLWNYYVRPEAQIEQLLKSGFNAIETYSWRTGKILDANERATNLDMWLYYLCVIN
ncbi:MAG: hypothetical protein AAFY11_08135, partial [Cyanobacteria bacterium J06641_5]